MKKDLLKTYDYVQSLYQKGNTSNEELSELLAMLKEISDARPIEISEDFKNLFKDLDLSEVTLNDARIMMMMFLTKLAVSYKPTNSSEFPHKLLELHFSNIVLMEELNNLFESSLKKIDVDLTNEKNKILIEDFFKTYKIAIDVLRSNHLQAQMKIEEWLKSIRY
jgi:hypothetical protein